jgi:hypothetical protein
MSKKIVVARMNHDGKEYVGKREVDTNEVTPEDGIVGLTLRVQREIRQALAVKYGIKSVSVGGAKVDTSDIETV